MVSNYGFKLWFEIMVLKVLLQKPELNHFRFYYKNLKKTISGFTNPNPKPNPNPNPNPYKAKQHKPSEEGTYAELVGEMGY